MTKTDFNPQITLSFSQRNGYAELPQPMQLETLSDDIRREIWNETRRYIYSLPRIPRSFETHFTGESGNFIKSVLGQVFKIPEDEIDTRFEIEYEFKKCILNVEFNIVLDLIEKMLEESPRETKFAQVIVNLFEKNSAAYWLNIKQWPYEFIPRSNSEHGEAMLIALDTLSESGMKSATKHLRNAAEKINDCQYADSIRESIHAVESVVRRIRPKNSNTLGQVLNSLHDDGLIKHGALKEAFSKLYGYTSDEQGIRHALIDKDAPDVGLDEAMFMFGACASFCAYLVSKNNAPV